MTTEPVFSSPVLALSINRGGPLFNTGLGILTQTLGLQGN